MSIVRKLQEQGLLGGVKPFITETNYEVIMGSFAYGVSSDTSDCDVYAFSTPPPEQVFPHINGFIYKFGDLPKVFETFQKHHIQDPKHEHKMYDIAIHSLPKYFQLCMENNPNMIDSLFVPPRCIVHSDEVGQLMRSHRKMFLHKGSWHKLKGYAYSQLKKLHTKKPTGKRAETVEKYGYDVKFAYHIVRLLDEGEQILMDHDLDLERNREQLKEIRAGEWTLEYLEEFFKRREASLDEEYFNSTLQHSPPKDKITQLLMECLEIQYGSLDKYVSAAGESGELAIRKLAQIKKIIDE